jgi:hypothetical protein
MGMREWGQFMADTIGGESYFDYYTTVNIDRDKVLLPPDTVLDKINKVIQKRTKKNNINPMNERLLWKVAALTEENTNLKKMLRERVFANDNNR